MNFRRMGATGLECSVVGLGAGRLASVANGLSRAGAGRLLGVAEDCGINLIDTADSYAQGESEKMIGAALQGKRSQFIIVTKAGYTFTALGGGLRLLKPLAKRALKYLKGGKNLASNVRSNVSRQNFSAEAIRHCIHGSLQRLRTDYLDVFLLHCPPLPVMADDQLFQLLRDLKQAGKIRHFGVSSPEVPVLERALQVPGVAVIQTPLNPAQTGSQPLLNRFQKAGTGIIANQIFFSGKLLDADGNDQQVHKLKSRLENVAAAKGISLHRLLIEFALSRPGVATVLTGTNNPEHLKQNVADSQGPAVFSTEELSQLAASEALISSS